MLQEYTSDFQTPYLHRGRVWRIERLLLLLLLGSLFGLSLHLLGSFPELLHVLQMFPGCGTELVLKCMQLCILCSSLHHRGQSAGTHSCRQLEGTHQCKPVCPSMQTIQRPSTAAGRLRAPTVAGRFTVPQLQAGSGPHSCRQVQGHQQAA